MRGYRLWICGLALLLLTGLTAFAQRGGDAPPRAAGDAPATRGGKTPQGQLVGDLPELLKAMNLDVDMQTKVNAKIEAANDQLKAWDTQHQEQMTKLQNDARSTDTTVADPAKAQLKPLREEREKLVSSLQAGLKKDIVALLTPEQLQTLMGLRVYQQQKYADMVKVLGLTTDQDAKLKIAATTYGVGLSKWEDENGDKAHQLEQQIKDAQATLNTLRASREKLEADRNDAVKATLTPEQQLAWASYNLQQKMLDPLKRAKLTDEQIAKVKALCDQAAKDIPAAPTGRGGSEVVSKLQQTILDTVLTDDQRAEMKKGGR